MVCGIKRTTILCFYLGSRAHVLQGEDPERNTFCSVLRVDFVDLRALLPLPDPASPEIVLTLDCNGC